jgi:hypothetical protein
LTYKSEDIREAAFKIMEAVGNPAKRYSRGQQWLVRLADGTKANLKTAGKGGLMVKTRSTTNDAEIVGFNADVSHILAAVRLRDEDIVTAYLIPMDVVERAYRRNNYEWCAQKPGRATDTWVLRFYDRKRKIYGDNMAFEWAEYRIGSVSLTEDNEPTGPKSVLEHARNDIAVAYGVEPEQVKISVDL